MDPQQPQENGHKEVETLQSAKYGPGPDAYEWAMPAELAVRILVSVSQENGGKTFRRHLAAVITGTEPELEGGRGRRTSSAG